MKNLILPALLLLMLNTAKSQTNKNTEDLNFLYQTIKKLPSYKDQVKINPKLNYDLSKDFSMDDQMATFEVFKKLYSLISPLRDNHLGFYGAPDSTFTKPAFLEISKSVVDSARSAQNQNDSLLGTYYADKYQLSLLKIGQDYVGVIENQNRYFTQFVMREVTPKHFDYIGFKNGGANYFLLRNVVYVNQRLTGLPWKKYQTPDFNSPPNNAPKYEYKKLTDDIAYLKLGSFATTNDNIAESLKFFNGIGEISAKQLIVDLRNNGGGGYKTSKKFLDLVKEFKGPIHLLVNNYTVSNAEQFTIDLMNIPRVTTYGENTRGTICYGNNMDTTVDLPSKRFRFYITDMRTRPQDLAFESIGIQPKVALNPFTKDWVEQVLEKIKSN